MFIVGLVGFAIASAVAGAAPDIETLITARAVQGGFAAVMAPAALSLITVIFTDLKELNKAFAIFGAVAGSSSAIGLMLGGLLTDYADWRWTMYFVSAFVGQETSASPSSSGAPIEWTHGTNSPLPSASRAWVPMRVMIRMCTTA